MNKKTGKLRVCLLRALTLLTVLAMLPLGSLMIPAAAVSATAGWDTGATTLYVDDAADLWAFAAALNSGTNFAGRTIKLTADITVNRGWNAMASSVSRPTDVWPLNTADRKFSGTFDGQGHTVSGLYMTAVGEGIGLFGNIATGSTGEVKNVTILNSYVEGGSSSNGVGGIFGEVDNETTASPITDETYVNKTRAIVDNVYAQIHVVCKGSGNTQLGTGGIIGGVRTDAEITNTTFAGKVNGGVRGAAAFIGAIRTYQTTYNGVAETNFYLHTVTLKNCLADATVSCSNKDAFIGAFIGYSNSNTTTHNLENVLSTCSVIEGTAADKQYLGNAFGGTHTPAHSRRDSGVVDYQTWNLTDVHYLTVAGTVGVFGKTTSGQRINGVCHPHTTKAALHEVIGEVLQDSLKQSVTLKNDLTLNAYALIWGADATVTINDTAVQGTPVSDAGVRFSLGGVLPQQMRDTYTLRITQTVAGKTFTISRNMSVRGYCEALWGSDFATKAEKDLVADLLRYGAQTQKYAAYNQGNLATAGMNLTGYGSTVTANSIAEKYNLTASTSTSYGFLGAALSLDNSIELKLKLKAPTTTDLKVTVAINGRSKTFSAGDFASAGGQTYVLILRDLGAHEMNAPITATLKNGTQTVQTLTYSVADYCKAVLLANVGSDAQRLAEQDLIRAAYAYGLSASAYNDTNRLVVINGTKSDYVIVYDDANALTKTLAYEFAAALERKTGVMLPVVADTASNSAKEIIIGQANGRSETTTAYNQLTSYNKKGYRISIVGTDIILVSGTDVLMETAVEDLLGDIRTHGGDTWSIPLDYSAQIDLPTYSYAGTQKIYYTNEQNHTLSITGLSKANYTSYVALLKSNGFVEYTTNEINGNLFGTYVKTEKGANMVAYTAFYPGGSGYYTSSGAFTFNTKNNTSVITQANCRITYGPLDFLPGTEEITAGATGVRTTPVIMQPARMNAFMRSSGMCYVIQLLDGRFILLDGGNKDGQVKLEGSGADKDQSAYYTYENGKWVQSSDVKTTNDTQAIYNLLKEMSPDEKPVVAAWIMSHAHGDHINMAFDFIKNYHDYVDVEIFAHNFPEASVSTNIGMNGIIANYNTYLDTYYPNAVRWIVHTGQKLYLPGCNIEIFFTPEDFYGIYDQYTFSNYSKGEMAFENGNETSLMFRITLGETTFMVTGDSEVENCTQAGTRYQTALRSDILQTPHHGLNGPELGFYEYVDPKIVLWSIDEHRVAEDARCLGKKWSSTVGDGYWYPSNGTAYAKSYGKGSDYYANGWLQTSNWTRGSSSGRREIYGVSALRHTKIFCSYPEDFGIIVTPMMPLS